MSLTKKHDAYKALTGRDAILHWSSWTQCGRCGAVLVIDVCPECDAEQLPSELVKAKLHLAAVIAMAIVGVLLIAFMSSGCGGPEREPGEPVVMASEQWSESTCRTYVIDCTAANGFGSQVKCICSVESTCADYFVDVRWDKCDDI